MRADREGTRPALRGLAHSVFADRLPIMGTVKAKLDEIRATDDYATWTRLTRDFD